MLEAAQIREMTTSQKLQALEQLWEAVGRDETSVPSPAWHGEVLAERRSRAAAGDARFLTLEQLQARFRDRRK